MMINNFINLNDNDEFVKFRGIDLQELIVQVENCFLEYRDSLGLPYDFTFGVEIEYERFLKKMSDRFVEKNIPSWKSKRDGSLINGGEIISPIMKDKLKYWQELKQICDYLTRWGADTSHNAGGHIHIGAHVLEGDISSWRTFLKLYIIYEGVLSRFSYGDKISARKELLVYAPPIADILYPLLDEINDAKDVNDLYYPLPTSDRYQALNFQNVVFFNRYIGRKNTLEFRNPNATTNAIIWQNNINTFSKMLLSSKIKVINEDFLDYKLENEFMLYSEHKYLYDSINLKNALEFVDLVFDNNLDKVYFLRQYLKEFQDGYGLKNAVKAKKFVK